MNDTQRRLADVGRRWADDHGDPDKSVRAALAGVRDAVSYLRAVAALCASRLLLPIIADRDDAGGGPDPDRHAEMAAVSLRGADGRLALLAFTGVDAVTAWNRDARPVPGTLDDVAATVAEAGSDVLLIDVAGPSPLEIGPDLLEHLAAGRRLVELSPGEFGWLAVPR
ncbi:MAG: SseB family protein [Propionibacterium sp.]|nr:SseB family protein [Propionibacterium sp.]